MKFIEGSEGITALTALSVAIVMLCGHAGLFTLTWLTLESLNTGGF